MKLISNLLIIATTLATIRAEATSDSLNKTSSPPEAQQPHQVNTSTINEDYDISLLQWYIHASQFLFAALLVLTILALIYAILCRLRLNKLLQKHANELIRSLFNFYFKYIFLFLSVITVVSIASLTFFLLNDFNYGTKTEIRLVNASNNSLRIYQPFENYLLIEQKQKFLFNVSLFRLPDWVARFVYNYIEYPFLIVLNLLLVQLLMLKKVRLYIIDRYLQRSSSTHQRKRQMKNKFRSDARCDFNKLMKAYRKVFHFFARIYLFNYSTLFGTIVSLSISFAMIFIYTFDLGKISSSIQIDSTTLNVIFSTIFKALIVYLSLVAFIRIIRIKLKVKKRPKLSYMSPYDDSDNEATNDLDNDLIELNSTSAGSVSNVAETPSGNTTLPKTLGGSVKKRDNADQMSKFNAINDDEFIKTNRLMKQVMHARLGCVLFAAVLMFIYCALSITAMLVLRNMDTGFIELVARRLHSNASHNNINFIAVMSITCLCIKFLFYLFIVFFSWSFLYQFNRSLFSSGAKKVHANKLKNGNKGSLKRAYQYSENEHLTRNYRSLSKSNSKNQFFNTMSAHSSHTLDSNEQVSKDSEGIRYSTHFMNMFYGYSDAARASKQPAAESGTEMHTQASSEAGDKANLIPHKTPKSGGEHRRTSSKNVNQYYFENLHDNGHLGNLSTDLFSLNHLNASASHYDQSVSISGHSNVTNLNNTSSFSTFKRSPKPADPVNSTLNKATEMSYSHSHDESPNSHEMKPILKSAIQEDPAYSSTQLFQVSPRPNSLGNAN